MFILHAILCLFYVMSFTFIVNGEEAEGKLFWPIIYEYNKRIIRKLTFLKSNQLKDSVFFFLIDTSPEILCERNKEGNWIELGVSHGIVLDVLESSK